LNNNGTNQIKNSTADIRSNGKVLDKAENREEEQMIYYIVTDVNDVVLIIESDIISKFFVAYGEKKLAELN
jgi:hypothetical protein